MSRVDAEKLLKEKGIRYEIEGDSDKVYNQMPKGGTIIPRDSKLFVYCGDTSTIKKVIVPRVIGMTPQNANKDILNSNLNVRITGAKISNNVTVYSQDPMPGTQVEVGSIITVEFRGNDLEVD